MTLHEHARIILWSLVAWAAVVAVSGTTVSVVVACTAPTSAPPIIAAAPQSRGPFPARVLFNHDGDTVRLEIDLGFGVYTRQDIRIYGIDAPELEKALYPVGPGLRARSALQDLIPDGSPVQLWTTRNQARSFSRYVGSLALPDGRDVAAEMVNSGNARWADADANPVPGPVTPLR